MISYKGNRSGLDCCSMDFDIDSFDNKDFGCCYRLVESGNNLGLMLLGSNLVGFVDKGNFRMGKIVDNQLKVGLLQTWLATLMIKFSYFTP